MERKNPYPGEIQDLLDYLDGERQALASELGTSHPLFLKVHRALTLPPTCGDLERVALLRAASVAVRTYRARTRLVNTK